MLLLIRENTEAECFKPLNIPILATEELMEKQWPCYLLTFCWIWFGSICRLSGNVT